MALFNKFGKNKTRVGLDIGNRSLKLVEIKDVGGELYLTAVGVKELRAGIVVNGEIKDKPAFIEAVTTLVNQCDSAIVDVVISQSGRGVLSDKFNFKIAPNEDVTETVLWEAGQRSPFDAEDITISFEVLRQFPETHEVEVLLVAAKNQIIQDYIDTLYEAGLRPVIVDVDIYAFNNSYAMESYAEAALETLVLVDVGHVGSRVIFIRNGLYHSSREIMPAGDYFAKTIQKQLKIPESDAVALLYGRQLPHVSDVDLRTALNDVFEEFVSGFNMAFSYFQKTEEVDRIDKVVLCGGGVYVPGFIPFLANRLETEVVMSNPFACLRYESGLFRTVDPTKFAALLTVAIGLALRKVD